MWYVNKMLSALTLSLTLCLPGVVCAHQSDPLPKPLLMELKRLEEAWHVLDLHGQAIWPGWNSHRVPPFHFQFPNGLEMLVGHPDPTDDFVLVPGVQAAGKAVCLNRKKEIPLKLEGRMQVLGGGISYVGKQKRIPVVSYMVDFVSDHPSDPLSKVSDGSILIHAHELFHCFQGEQRQWQFGNLMLNPDGNFAVWAEVEGLALEKAYLEKDPEKCRVFAKDFLAARKLKRTSMDTLEANQESECDFMEGTATFAEARALELLQKGHQPLISIQDDPYYGAFKLAPLFLEQKLQQLRQYREFTFDSSGKCYEYGSFQALLLNRLSPGWQEGFMPSQRLLDQHLQSVLGVSPAELDAIGQQLAQRYPLDQIRARHLPLIEKRDQAYRQITARTGRSYVVDFKPTQEFPIAQPRGEHYSLGLMNLYPKGVEKIQIRQVLLEGKETPMLGDQIYYLKWVDSENPTGSEFSIDGLQESKDTWANATFACAGFTLKAPRLQILQDKERVKVRVLSKIVENPGKTDLTETHAGKSPLGAEPHVEMIRRYERLFAYEAGKY